MANAREIFHRQPPMTLYHYTNQAGLLGIIRSKEIWATHTQYLNDTREFRHAVELARNRLGLLETAAPDPALPDDRPMISTMKQAASVNLESVHVCVTSFSERGDNLAQWRAYGGSSGFSIGFAGDFLRAIARESEFWLVPCLYTPSEQSALINTLIEDVLNENRGKPALKPPTGNLQAYLFRYAPILKDNSFEEEKEWRIITRPIDSGNDRYDFRVGTSMVIPYYRIPLSSGTVPFHVQDIIVGPSPNADLSVDAVQSLLFRHGLDDVNVYASSVPYRNW